MFPNEYSSNIERPIGCLRCGTSVIEVLERAYKIRNATYDSEYRLKFYRQAILDYGGLWDLGSTQAPLVTGFMSKVSGMSMTNHEGYGQPESPLSADGLAKNPKPRAFSQLYFVDAPIETAGFTMRVKCQHCEQAWSIITINRRMLTFASFVYAHFLKSKVGSIYQLLETLLGTDTESVKATEELAAEWADDSFRIIATVFVICHEQAHIDGPDRFQNGDGDFNDLSKAEIELFCDKSACRSIYIQVARKLGYFDFEVIAEIFATVVLFLTSARLLAQSRSWKINPPPQSGYPTFDERIASVMVDWKHIIQQYDGYEEKVDHFIDGLTEFVSRITITLQRELQ